MLSLLCDWNLDSAGTSEVAQTIARLNNEQKISLLSPSNIDSVRGLEHHDFWQIQYLISEAIPKLKCATTPLLTLVKVMVEKAGNDGLSHAPVASLTEWFSANPTQAHEVLQGAKQSDELCQYYCVSALKGLGDFAQMTDFTNCNDAALSSFGIRAMGISSRDLDVDEAKQALQKCHDVLCSSTNEEIRLTAIDSAFRLWSDANDVRGHLQGEIIDNVIAANIEREKHQLLSCLFYHESGLSEQAVSLILKHAASPSENSEAIVRLLDQALMGSTKGWDFDDILAVFDAHLPMLSADFDARGLSHFFRMVWEDPDKTSQLIASWLTRGDFVQCSILVNAMSERAVKASPIALLKQHLPKGANDQIFLARKCIGFLWHREVTAASLLLSMYKNAVKQSQESIESLLFDPLLLSYGGDLRDYLESEKGSLSKSIRDVVDRLLKQHDDYLENLKTPAELVEFHPSTDQRRAVAMKDRERNRSIRKMAHQRSIFADLVSTSILLYGRGSFVTVHHGDGKTSSSVMPMQQMSHSTEIPRLMVVDPAGFQQLLAIFRMEKRISS